MSECESMLMHVWAPIGPHAHCEIVGTRAALRRLGEVINAVASGAYESGGLVVMDGSGEGYLVMVRVAAEAEFDRGPTLAACAMARAEGAAP